MAQQCQVFDIGVLVQVTAHRRGDSVPSAGVGHGVEAVAEHIGIVAQPPIEGVLAVAAVEDVVAVSAIEGVVAAHPVEDVVAVEAIEGFWPGVAGQHVGELVAGAVDIGRKGQRQVLDAGIDL